MTTLNVDNGDSAAIKYEVVRNGAVSKMKGTDVYNARVQAATKSLREVAETMVREGSKYEVAEVVAVLEKFTAVTARLIQEGNAINVGSLVHFRPSIRGTFENMDDQYQAGKQRIVVGCSIGSALRNIAANAPTQKMQTVVLPQIKAVFSGVTGAADRLAYHGDLVVQGVNLDWVEGDDTGFFLEVEGESYKCTPFNVTEDKKTVMLHTDAEIIEGETAHLFLITKVGGAVIGYKRQIAFEATEV